MNCVLLCEGETDQIILSEYFCNQFGFKYCRDNKLRKSFAERAANYQNEKHSLDIIFAQGHEFARDLDTILQINRMNTDVVYDRIIIMTDRDTRQEATTVWQHVIEKISKFTNSKILIQENQWLLFKQSVGFGEEIQISLLLIAIPIEKEGALETFLLDAFRREKGNSYLVDQAQQLVDTVVAEKDSLDENEFNHKYLKERRMQIKAPLAVFMALAWPDRSFVDLKDMMKRVPWNDYAEVQMAFCKFDIFNS